MTLKSLGSWLLVSVRSLTVPSVCSCRSAIAVMVPPAKRARRTASTWWSVPRHPGEYAIRRTPDVPLIRVGQFSGDLQRDRQFTEAEAVRVGHHTQEMTAFFGGNQHVAVG